MSSSCMSVEKQYVMKFSSSGPFGTRLIAPREPAIETATDRTVGNVHYVASGPQDNALAACVGAAALSDDAGNRAGVGADFRNFLAFAHLVDDDLFSALASHFGGNFSEKFLLHFFGIDEFGLAADGFLLD